MTCDDFVTQLHIKYETTLLKGCYRYVHYDARYFDLAEDCVQDTFFLLFQRYEQLKDHPCIGRWLYITCIHKLNNAVYKNRVREKRTAFSIDEHLEAPLSDPQAAIDKWLDKEASAACIQRIRQTLTEKESAVFDDYFLQGLTAEETAYRRATTIGGVKSMLRKIRQKSRREKLEGFLLLLGILSHFN